MFIRVVLLVLLIASIVIPIMAQDDEFVLTFGEPVSGEITNREFEIEYSFTGSQGGVIRVEMLDADGSRGNLDGPQILLLDSEFNLIGESSGLFNFHNATLFAELPLGGEYFILATREDGRSGESVGTYTLVLDTIDLLPASDAVTSEITTETVDYYLIDTAEPVYLGYRREGGTFHPEVVIADIRENALNVLGTLEGDALVTGTIMINPTADEAQPYIIVVREDREDFNFDEKTVEYSLWQVQE